MITVRPAEQPYLFVGLAGVLLLSASALLPPLAAVLLAALLIAYLLLAPGLAVPLLVLAAALNRLAYPWGASSIRIELLVALLLAAVIVNRIAVRTLPLRSLSSPLLVPLAAYAAINVLSSLLSGTDRMRGLKLDAEIVAAVLVYVVFVTLVRTRADLALAIRTLWIVTVGEAIIGLLAMLAYVAHLTSLGVQAGDFGLPMVYGTQWEANIFGSYLLGNFFLLLADYLASPRTAMRSLGLVLIVAGIGVSMTRTVWLALILGLAIFALLTGFARRGQRLLPILASIPILAVMALIVGSATPLAGRLLDIANLHSSSASGRFVIFGAALQEWRANPLLGTGTGSFHFGAIPGQPPPWLPNLTLLTLHDTGIVGLAILMWLVLRLYRTTIGPARNGGYTALMAAGAVTAFAALLLAFQTTSGFWFAYPWIVAGIGVAAARLSEAGE